MGSQGWLKKKRIEKGYTLRQLSEIVGVSEQSLSYYESGERRPTPEVAQKIGKVLGFDWTLFYTKWNRKKRQLA